MTEKGSANMIHMLDGDQRERDTERQEPISKPEPKEQFLGAVDANLHGAQMQGAKKQTLILKFRPWRVRSSPPYITNISQREKTELCPKLDMRFPSHQSSNTPSSDVAETTSGFQVMQW
ncbi:hypothetical protein NE237_028942 [Protea cynaroides]|uniref:Uncharacterized protein n=1 Tax=Protea cynaroides TaxID=273540 RepID=A0A9Q0GRB4_9MAGN|nr:hypothetical protein NE237_028942 [Protea cynaroides]